MQAPNAQGLMGLMAQGRTPQQPQQAQQPMPSPQRASPMAGLGSVEDRVAAYRGNPAPLQQRYQMSQDLLDLLALQKIKSEKEAAARDMQLKMSQQQAAQGMEPMTVAQQREKEVMDMTKNELAQQRGDTAGQQVQQQQAAMQRMLGGIAAAPGAAAAAQPKAMASGGIVAFAEGGDTGSALDSARERVKAARDKLYSYGLVQRQRDPEGFASLKQELSAAETALRDAEIAETGGPVGALRRPIAPPAPTNVPPAEDSASPIEIPRPAAPAAQAAPPAAPPVAPPTAAPVASAVTAPPPPAVGAGGAGGAGLGSLAGLVDKTAANLMNIDPEAKQLAMEERIRKMYELTPEQRAMMQQGITQRQKMFDETYDPERMRREGLKQFLIGAGGRRYGELGGGARVASRYDEEQRAQRLKDFGEMQKAREGLIGLEREGIKPSIEGGIAALREASTGQRSGLEAGFKRVEGALDRGSRERIAAESARIQREISQATRDQTLEIRRQGFMQEINKSESRAISDLQKGPLGKSIANLEQLKAMNPKGFGKEQQAQLDDMNKQLQEAEGLIRAQMDVYREQLGGFSGKPKTGAGSTPKLGEWGKLNVVPANQ